MYVHHAGADKGRVVAGGVGRCSEEFVQFTRKKTGGVFQAHSVYFFGIFWKGKIVLRMDRNIRRNNP
jgi:hypothetical protein